MNSLAFFINRNILIQSLLNKRAITKIYTARLKATQLYKKHCFKMTRIESIYLPSTSPGNCRYCTLDKLIEEYKIIMGFKKNSSFFILYGMIGIRRDIMDLKKAKKELVSIEEEIKRNIMMLNDKQELATIEINKITYEEIIKVFEATIKKNHVHISSLGYVELQEMKKEYKVFLSTINETIDFELANLHIWRHMDYVVPIDIDDKKYLDAQEKEMRADERKLVVNIYDRVKNILIKYGFILDENDFLPIWWMKNFYEYPRELSKLHLNMKKEAELRIIIQEQTALELWKNA